MEFARALTGNGNFYNRGKEKKRKKITYTYMPTIIGVMFLGISGFIKNVIFTGYV